MYRRILLAYDGTQAGREALRQGADLAVLCNAQVHLLAVVTPRLGITLAQSAEPSDLPEREKEDIHRVLEEGAEELRSKGLAVETRLGAGNPAEEIGRVARELGADLLVVGHREQSALARWWSGSVGASLLAHASCSILVAVSGDL
jgi:nucleotide-binding universal stress UspA family protein